MTDDPAKEYSHPSDFTYDTVATPSTHDTATLRGWWEEDYASTQRFYNQILGKNRNMKTIMNKKFQFCF